MQIVEETARGILSRVPSPVGLEDVMEKYPVKYEESMNTVLIQEVHNYTRIHRNYGLNSEVIPYAFQLTVIR